MMKWGFVLAAFLIAGVGWIVMTYLSVPSEVAGIQARLPAEQALNAMPLDQTVEALKSARADCQRVRSLASNPLARYMRGDEIKSLFEQCDLIKSRQDALSGP